MSALPADPSDPFGPTDPPQHRWTLGLAAFLIAAPVLAYLQLVWSASVDVPYLDDYDTIVAFLDRYHDEDAVGGRLRLLFAQHNEHRIVLTRLAAVGTQRLFGVLDFTALNLLGSLGLIALLGALFMSFRAEDPPARRLLGFAPAALFLFHPQYWSAMLWPTAGLGSFLVAGLAGVAFVGLARGSTAGFAAALLAAPCASFGQGNGVFVPLLGVLVAWLVLPRRRALAWTILAGSVVAVFVATYQQSPYQAPISASLDHPIRLLAYVLNLIGCAPGFSRPIVSMIAGALLLGSLAILTARGLARRNPVLFALLLFVLASVAANALGRSLQGSAAALHQPRYRFYSALFLSLTWLAWAELGWERRLGRRLLAAALPVAIAFSGLSYRVYRGDVMDLAGKLSAGFEHWWVTGRGGLFYPDATKASAIALNALGSGHLRIPDAWLEQHAAKPVAPDLPPADRQIRFRIRALHQDGQTLLVAGWAHAGMSARDQAVEMVLRSRDHSYVFTTLGVLRSDIPARQRQPLQRFARAGFRALIPLDEIAPGDYRLGLLVRQGARRYLIWRKAPVTIPAR